MKKLVVLLAVVCCASMAFATNYNPLTDWVLSPGAPSAWQFGGRLQAIGEAPNYYSNFTFGAFLPANHVSNLWTGAPDGDAWLVPDTASTTSVWWKEPWRGTSVAMMAWTFYASVARVTPEAATYNLAASFIGTGYAAPETQTTNVLVVKNGSTILWQGQIQGANAYTTAVGTTLSNITFAAGDYLDFISANGSDNGESRTSLTANLTLVPEPATMILLGLGGLLLRKRK